MVSEYVNCANLPLVAHCLAPRLHQRRALCPGSAQRGRARHQLAVLFKAVEHDGGFQMGHPFVLRQNMADQMAQTGQVRDRYPQQIIGVAGGFRASRMASTSLSI